MRRKASVWLGVVGFTTAMVCGTTSASAAVINVTGHVDDYDIRQPSSGTGTPITVNSTTSTSLSFGARTSTRGHNAVFIFALPVLPSGEGVSTANFAAAVTASLGPGTAGHFGVDVWGIGFQSSTTPITEYLEADTDTEPTNVKIHDNFMVTNTTYPNNTKINTDETADIALADYLKTFYLANPGYAGGSYVFLRLNPDVNPDDLTDTNSGYTFASANHGTSTLHPQLTIETTILPEPASLALMGLGSLLIGVPRRR